MRLRTCVLCLFIFAQGAFGQATTGAITGTIADPAGAVVPGAPVEVKNTDTGVVYKGGASATGNFIIPGLPAGKYEMTVTVTGFKKFVQQNLQVVTDVETRQDVNLTVGAVTDTVTVTESAPLLKTESGEISHIVTTDLADELPVLTIGNGAGVGFSGLGNGLRDPLQMMVLLPGVTYSTDTNIVVNGLPNNTESLRIEGQDATNGIYGEWTSSTQAGTDAIQEVSVQTSNFAAEYGQAAGGYINFTMKSGTNQYHGSMYDYMRNEALNAGEPYTDRCVTNSLQCGQHVRPRIRQNDWGLTFGGAIRIPKLYNGKNKSFFFFNWEQFLTAQQTSGALSTVPTTNYENGNFGAPYVNALGVTTAIGTTPTCTAISAACPAIGGLTYTTINGAIAHDGAGALIPEYGVYDPLTSRTTASGIVNTLFPNGIIPANRMDPVALKIQSLLPQPTNTNLVNNYQLPNYNNNLNTENWSLKLDHSISPTIKISGFYNFVHEVGSNYNGYLLGGSVAQSDAITGVVINNTSTNTFRVNYDQTLRPTLLLHFGVGYLHLYYPYYTNPYQGTPPVPGFYDSQFPSITGLYSNGTTGGNLVPLGTNFAYGKEYDEKITGNTSLTWVKSNHTFKFGGELQLEGQIVQSIYRANGVLGFSGNETSDQWQGAQGVTPLNPSGFGYASFLLGGADSLGADPYGSGRLGNHGIGLYAQDSWKVNRKLTLDYGLRYDFQSYLHEQYGRLLDANLYGENTVLNEEGTVIFEGSGPGHCNCAFSHNYPWGFGPRLGIAYQINSKTVFRGGAGINFGQASQDSQLIANLVPAYNFAAPGYGIPAVPSLSAGNPYAPGNPGGNPALVFPNTNPDQFPVRSVCANTANATCYTPGSPPFTFDKSARPPRVFTWSVGLQRELNRNLVVEASYVGNRAAWVEATYLDILPLNAVNLSDVAKFKDSQGNNLNIVANAADRTLLGSTISSVTAIQRGFGTPSYPGMPATTLVEQTLRPRPQWNTVTPYLGPPLGDTWYDSLQTKMTKRFSHGFQATGSYVYSKALALGAINSVSLGTGSASPTTIDIYNPETSKQLNPYNPPNQLVFSGVYTVPKPGFTDNKVVRQVVKDWQLGAVLRYQSGALLGNPTSLNGLTGELDRGPYGTNYWNLVNGDTNLITVNPNSHFDPTKQLVLNPAAWADVPGGTWTSTATGYNNYRWQRQPSEAMSFARNFRMGKEGKYNLSVRAEFQNVFNRHFFSTPSLAAPTTTVTNTNAYYTGGPPPTHFREDSGTWASRAEPETYRARVRRSLGLTSKRITT